MKREKGEEYLKKIGFDDPKIIYKNVKRYYKIDRNPTKGIIPQKIYRELSSLSTTLISPSLVGTYNSKSNFINIIGEMIQYSVNFWREVYNVTIHLYHHPETISHIEKYIEKIATKGITLPDIVILNFASQFTKIIIYHTIDNILSYYPEYIALFLLASITPYLTLKTIDVGINKIKPKRKEVDINKMSNHVWIACHATYIFPFWKEEYKSEKWEKISDKFNNKVKRLLPEKEIYKEYLKQCANYININKFKKRKKEIMKIDEFYYPYYTSKDIEKITDLILKRAFKNLKKETSFSK